MNFDDSLVQFNFRCLARLLARQIREERQTDGHFFIYPLFKEERISPKISLQTILEKN